MSDDELTRDELLAALRSTRDRVTRLESELEDNRLLSERFADSEERFRQVTDHIDEVFWMTDPRKDRMLFISKAYERIWGRTCESLIAAPLSFLDDIHPDDRAAVIEAFPRQQAGTYDIEYRIVRRDGGVRWIRDKAFPVADASGTIYRVVGVAQDITENKMLIQALREETEKSERLLENVLPRSIIRELKRDASSVSVETPVVAQRIEHATVLFADIVGYTAFAKSLAAEVVVDTLNKLMRLFDQLVEKHQVEKIKTVGDCYMLAGGVPESQTDHAHRVADVALEMRERLREFNAEHGQTFQVRIGIHSGELVAGVIGSKKYVYDIWGDTVNTASRMESHGLPGEIQISEDTHRYLDSGYLCEDRGVISVKGRGEVRTFFLKNRLG